MIRAMFITLLVLDFGYKLFRDVLIRRQRKKPLPKSVSDIHDKKEYARWLEYQNARQRLSLARHAVRFVVMLVLFSTDAFAWLYAQLSADEFGANCQLLCVYFLLTTLVDAPFAYISQFKIEAKYGMNRCSIKTFIADCIRSWLLNAGQTCGFCVLYLFAYNQFEAQFFWVTCAGALGVLLLLELLSGMFARIGNKLTPLEAGGLKTKLTELFAKEGYHLKEIYVMDASRRTTKANAFCTGIGRLKKIVLYDNLVNDYTEDEIIAVFAHELAHYKNHDAAKVTLFSIAQVLVLNAAMSAFFLVPQISMAFGFAGPCAALAVLTVLDSEVFGFVNVLWQAASSAFIRPMEIRADALAVDYGYGEAMISFFRKLVQKDLGDYNPHPVLIALEDEHPPLSRRIDAIRARMKQR